MTLLAHWKLGDGRNREPAKAIDAAAGGSGAHDGDYYWTGLGSLFPGGVGGSHMYSTYGDGYVHNIANAGDLRALKGSMTAMMWLHHWDEYNWWNYGTYRYMFTCDKAGWASEADNTPWSIYAHSASIGKPRLKWQHGATPTVVDVISAISIPVGWYHLAVVRYEISAGFYGVKFYYDGLLVDTRNNGGPGWPMATGGTTPLPDIGRSDIALNSYYCHYFIDSVRLYDTEESDANILSVYNAEAGIVFPSVEEFGFPGSNVGPGYVEYKTREEGPYSVREDAGFVW